MKPSPTDATAIVTGAARRIGRAISLALADAGYRVVIHANRSRDDAEQLRTEIAARGGHAVVVCEDLSRADAGKVIEAARAAGPLTLLVNNASEFEHDDIHTLDPAQFDRAIAINLRAPLLLAQAFARAVTPGTDAAIVNLLDQRVFKPTPRFLSYGLSKSALHTATVTLAQALAPGIRVNAVAPGPVLPSPRQSAEDFARQAATLPLGGGPSPDDIAQAVLYLARARSVTGQTICVDGGQHIAWRTPDSDVIE